MKIQFPFVVLVHRAHCQKMCKMSSMVWDKCENPMSVSVMATIASSNLFCIIIYYCPLLFFSVFVFVPFLFFFSCFWYGTRRYEIWHLWLMSYLLDGTAGQKRDLWTLSEDFPAYFLPMSWSFISSFNYLKASQYFIDSCINYLKFISISCHKIKLQDVARIQKKIKSPWVLLK